MHNIHRMQGTQPGSYIRRNLQGFFQRTKDLCLFLLLDPFRQAATRRIFHLQHQQIFAHNEIVHLQQVRVRHGVV